MLTAASLYALAPGAHAAMVTIDFSGLDGSGTPLMERPANFYNGGLGSLGSGPGPDYGITFLPFDATSSEPTVTCPDTSDCGQGQGNLLWIFGDHLNGKQHGTILHVEGGFRGVVEFDASISNLGSFAKVSTKTSLDNQSNITFTDIRHPDPTDDCQRLQCEFAHYSFDLADDIFTPDDVVAHYILIYTNSADVVYIDNIKFHDLILPDAPPTTVPEPSTAMMIGGMGLLGAMLRRRRTDALRAPSERHSLSNQRT
jgi:hypothetical protein